MSDYPAQLDERALVRRFVAHERDALAEAYARFASRVFTSSYRILGDSAAAEDVCHDSFVRAFSRSRQFRGNAGLCAWICRIAINISLRRLRREQRWLGPERLSEIPAPPRAVSESIDLHGAILQLPGAFRVIVELRAIHGYTYPEIAVMLDLSEAACRQRFHRARVMLAHHLDHGPLP